MSGIATWSEGELTCDECLHECSWTDCEDCGGDGGHDGYDEDPLWYRPNNIIPCSQCLGKGGWWYCENRECKSGTITEFNMASQNGLEDVQRDLNASGVGQTPEPSNQANE